MNTQIQYWLDHNLKNFLKKNNLEEKEILQLINWLNLPSSNKYLRQIHKLSVTDALKKCTENQTHCQKQQLISDESIKIVATYPDNISWALLTNEAAYKRDSLVLENCLKEYVTKDTLVYSLRKNNKAVINLEFDACKNQVTQIEGFKNKFINSKYYNYVYDLLFYKKYWGDITISLKALQKINLHEDANGLFSWSQPPELIQYSNTTILNHLPQNKRFIGKTITVKGDLHVTNNHAIEIIADCLVVTGTIFIRNCSQLKKIAHKIYAKSIEIKECPQITNN